MKWFWLTWGDASEFITKRLPSWLPRILCEILIVSGLTYWIQQIGELDRYPGGDGPHILGTAGRLAQMLADGEFEWFVYCFSSLLGPHPPFAYIPYIISTLLFSNLSYNHLIGSALVLWIIWDSMWRLNAGLIGMISILTFSPVLLQFENAGIDLVVAAAVLQSCSHLAKSNQLKNQKHTVLWGAWIGVAFMTKYTGPMFLWAPCLLAGYWTIRHNHWKRLLQGIGGFCIVAIPWWSTHWQQVQGYVLASGNGQSGLLTNKTIIDNPWTWEHIQWYPTATADAVGWIIPIVALTGLLLGRTTVFEHGKKIRQWTGLVGTLAVLGGWIFLNHQKQRQDRYIVPAYPIMAAGIGMAPIWLSTLAIPSLWKVSNSTLDLYLSPERMPSERKYTHDINTPAATYPIPSESYWPISHHLEPWKITTSLERVREVVGSDSGTVGFLLDEQGGAPGYGIILSNTIQLGYRWHIATIMIARPQGPQANDPNRPLASVFVGPFIFGEWPSREFDVMLSMVKHNDPQREKWIESTGMVVLEEWNLPMDRKGRIYVSLDKLKSLQVP